MSKEIFQYRLDGRQIEASWFILYASPEISGQIPIDNFHAHLL